MTESKRVEAIGEWIDGMFETDTPFTDALNITEVDPLTAVARTMREALQSILDCAPCPICVTTAEDAIASFDALDKGE